MQPPTRQARPFIIQSTAVPQLNKSTLCSVKFNLSLSLSLSLSLATHPHPQPPWTLPPAGSGELEVDAELKSLLRPLLLSTRARLAEERGGEPVRGK